MSNLLAGLLINAVLFFSSHRPASNLVFYITQMHTYLMPTMKFTLKAK